MKGSGDDGVEGCSGDEGNGSDERSGSEACSGDEEGGAHLTGQRLHHLFPLSDGRCDPCGRR